MKVHCSKIVAIGEAAVVGAGVGVALIGALEIATAITAPLWLTEAKNYIDYAPLVGGAVGAIVGEWRIAWRRRWAAAKSPEEATMPLPESGQNLREFRRLRNWMRHSVRK